MGTIDIGFSDIVVNDIYEDWRELYNRAGSKVRKVIGANCEVSEDEFVWWFSLGTMGRSMELVVIFCLNSENIL